MSADFFSVALPLSADEANELLPTLADAEQQYEGNVYVDATEPLMGCLTKATPLAMSPNFPVFVALDRFSADRELLGGHAFRFVAPRELASLQTLVERLETNIDAAAAALDRHGNGRDDALGGLRALAQGITSAIRSERGLLLVCFPT